jgi:hypothetical protein
MTHSFPIYFAFSSSGVTFCGPKKISLDFVDEIQSAQSDTKQYQVVCGLRSNNQFHKCGSAGHSDVFPSPTRELSGTLILKELKINPKLPNRKGESKKSQWEGSTSCWDAFKKIARLMCYIE